MKEQMNLLLTKSGELLDIIDLMSYAISGYEQENDNASCLKDLMEIFKKRYHKLHSLIDKTNIKLYQANNNFIK